jgi:hypothetical protein
MRVATPFLIKYGRNLGGAESQSQNKPSSGAAKSIEVLMLNLFIKRVPIFIIVSVLFLFCGQLSTSLDSSDLRGNWERISTTTKWNNDIWNYKDYEIYFIRDKTLDQYWEVKDTVFHAHLNYFVRNDSIIKYPPGSIYGKAYKISFHSDTLFFDDSLFLHKFIRYNSQSFPSFWNDYPIVDDSI